MFVGVALLSMVACGTSRSECDGSPVRGVEELSFELTEVEAAGDAIPEAWIVENQQDWDSVTAEREMLPAMPDFETQLAFVNVWRFDGCYDFPTYTAYLYDDGRLRVAFDNANPGVGDSCDLDQPYMDIVVVDRVSEDLGWCD